MFVLERVLRGITSQLVLLQTIALIFAPLMSADYAQVERISSEGKSELRKLSEDSASLLKLTDESLRWARRFKRSPANSSIKLGGLPEFAAPIGNVSAVVGRDVRLVCTIDNLGNYQVSKRVLQKEVEIFLLAPLSRAP